MPHTDKTEDAPLSSKDVIASNLDFPVIGLGASAGGIEAIKRFFEHMPRDCGMAFVVILHLSPKHESNVDKILQRVTDMPVLEVGATVAIQKDHVYVISPALQLEMTDGHLRVSEARRPRERQISIDLFFRTLADAHRERAFAIVLSGTGADGTAGMARIKEHGGLTLAQLPDDAEFDGMPSSAIENGVVDFILPVSEMPQKLLDLWKNAARIEIPPIDPMPPASHSPPTQNKVQAAEAALGELLRLLSHHTGHDFKHYKRATVLRRIERRMQVTGVTDVPQYLSYFEKSPKESQALLGDLLIGVTNFFRDREAFEALERDIVPHIFESVQDDAPEGIRVWTAACSTGEEAYSLAMILAAEAATQKNPEPAIQVFASDVDRRAIAIARRGLYPASIMADVPPVLLRRFLSKEDAHFRIAKKIRDQILFVPHNVLNDPPFSRLHLITCRNFLIYLDRHAQRQVMETFHSALRPGGYLFLGTSETAEIADDLFTSVDKKNRIYCAALAPRKTVHSLPSLRRMPEPPPGQPRDYADVAANKQDSPATMHQKALEKYGPPTVLIDASCRILHMSGNVGKYLRHIDGEPSYHILSLVDPRMRSELRSALLRATNIGDSVETPAMPISRDGAELHLKISVWPLKDRNQAKPPLLLIFNEVDQSQVLAANASPDDGRDAAVEALENEVQTLSERLRDTIAHSDISTEDLRASNEELQAINEELRSATEELETSKEELQSMNEELITVNEELKGRVDETAKINDDLQNLISSSDIATIFVDGTMRIKWFTPKTTALFNLLPTDSGRLLTDITHRLEYAGMAADAAEAFEFLHLVEREVQSKDGRWYLARILPYRTTEDHISGATLNFVDVTTRRLAEERLREGLERLRLVAESTTQFAIITMDQSGRITGWNRAAELMFGYDASETIGQVFDIIFTPEDRAQNVPNQELQIARDRGHADDDRWHLHKNGTRFYCSGVLHPLVDGELRGYAKIARDMTHKHLEEDEQKENLARIHASNVMKDEFIAVMSHELRHPLNLIQLNVDLLARTPQIVALEGAAKAVEAIRRSVHSQSQIIEDLLDISRAKTGKLQLIRALINLKPVLSNVIEAVGSQVQASQIIFRTEGMDDMALDECVVDGDVVRIEQIAWNLLSNAIKFTPPGGTVTLSLARENTEARIDVRDTGIGIASESLGEVFQMFKQVNRQQNGSRPGGLGIGLALVAQLAQAHGGRVAVASEGQGSGATFTVWLPLAVKNREFLTDETSGSDSGLVGMRILLVDDSEEILEMLGELCRMEGAQVTTALGGRAALDTLAESDFDVLISDIGMPDIDGYALLAALRKSERNADLPAIALSGYAESARAREVGFVEQLKKPVPLDELLCKLGAIGKRH